MNMKRFVLAFILCCAFSMQSIAVNSDPKLNDIEIAQEKINALNAEQEVIRNKYKLTLDEMGGALKKTVELEDKIKSLERNPGVCSSAHLEALLKESENNIKVLTLSVAVHKLLLDLRKIDLNIDKANIDLIKAEIRARKTPKVPLELAKAQLKYSKISVKNSEAEIKVKQAQLKQEDANIRWLESYLEEKVKVDEIRKTINDSYGNVEIAELRVKEAILDLKLKQAQSKTAQAEIKKAQVSVELCKIDAEVCKTCLKFDKGINLLKFLNTDKM